MKSIIFISLLSLITRTQAQSLPPECVESPTNRPPGTVADITVTCGTTFMDLSILLCPIYNANFNESLLILNNQLREECKGTADFSVEPPVLRYSFPIDEQSVSACNNHIQITNHAGTGDFGEFSNIQFVTISGMVVTFDPTTGMITYRPQVTYMYSCRYPLQYVLNNTQMAVAGVNLVINENNGSFISSLKFSLYSLLYCEL
ncbi:zona pellucida-like domain-containing protein 1 [Eucyclogobius newberryi]|uniref:zona pellucida-like domain-containing protein 1 n=1 Tax=Eucyclogobius newberryi TaxID=166745 RepID=UPI003B5CE238